MSDAPESTDALTDEAGIPIESHAEEAATAKKATKRAAKKSAAKRAPRKKAAKSPPSEESKADPQPDQDAPDDSEHAKAKTPPAPSTPEERDVPSSFSSDDDAAEVPTSFSSDEDEAPAPRAERKQTLDDSPSADDETRAERKEAHADSEDSRPQRPDRDDESDSRDPREHRPSRYSSNQQGPRAYDSNRGGGDRGDRANREWKKPGIGRDFKPVGQKAGRPDFTRKGDRGGPPDRGDRGGPKGGKFDKKGPPPKAPGRFQQRPSTEFYGRDEEPEFSVGILPGHDLLNDFEGMLRVADEYAGAGDPIDVNALMRQSVKELTQRAAEEFDISYANAQARDRLVTDILKTAFKNKRSLHAEGILETTQDGYGVLVYQDDNYRVKPLSVFVPKQLIRRYGLKRGHILKATLAPPRGGEEHSPFADETCPYVLRIDSVHGKPPEEVANIPQFEDLVPYYPTERFLLETLPDVKWDNISMRVIDLLTPIGMGQRGLIVAPPRTGKTILQQGIANAIAENSPDTYMMVLLVDERPEEVTDFRRQITKGEVIASTFDEAAESHVHAAEMVISKARRMVEVGQNVIILLDSITRLARAYNALAANSGKILSGGVEASALQKPKRFFGSARNIEGGGSLTILGTALVETGSRMDEVIFEEFKGTGNMELHLDRALVDKRIFPAISFEKSGTRKEELLYHPDEMAKVYGLRRAMKGVPSTEAMEMLISRIRKTRTNAEFLMGLNR